MALRRHDLNLLPILDALLRHRNVTRAGKELGLSQSAMSHALMRLRAQFDDQLLTPSGRGLMTTHRAEAISVELRQIIRLLEHLLDDAGFEPAESNRRFKVGTADHVALVFLPSFTARLAKLAPGVSIQVTWDTDEKTAKLRSNHLDLALVPRGTYSDPDLHSTTILVDDMVIIASENHSVIGDAIDLEAFRKLGFARMRMENLNLKTFVDLQLEYNQLQPTDSVLVTNFLLLPFVVSQTDYVSLVSRRLAEQLRKAAPIKILQAPFPTNRLYLDAYWSHRAHNDPAHRWFREQLIEECAGL